MEPQFSSETFQTIHQTKWHLQSKGLSVFQKGVLARNLDHKNRRYQEDAQKYIGEVPQFTVITKCY
jgi:hypothetical protein